MLHRVQFFKCIYISPLIFLTTQVTHFKDIESWLHSTFYPFISGNGPGFHDSTEKNMASDGTSFIIGLVRLRQIRKRCKTISNKCFLKDVIKFVNTFTLCMNIC